MKRIILIVIGLLTAPAWALAEMGVPGECWMQYASPEEAGWSSNRIDEATALADSIGTAAYETRARAEARPDRGSHAPGEHWHYKNWDFNVLGTIFRRETGKDLFEAFQRRIADPLDMEDFRLRDGYDHLEPENSIHPAYPFRMSARDLARFGLLFLSKGAWDGEQVIPAEWIDESTASHSEVAGDPGTGYGYMWWTLEDAFEGRDGFEARGFGGHTITVIPDLEVVFVHRVNTWAGDHVGYARVRQLLDLLLAARSGEAGKNPRLVRLPDPPVGAAAAGIAPERLTSYEGSYPVVPGVAVQVDYDEGRLLLESNRLGRYALIPITKRVFLAEDARELVYFLPNESGNGVELVAERILLLQARALARAGRAEQALERLERAVEFYPASAGAHRALGDALVQAGRTDAAAAAYRRSAALDPVDLETSLRLARLAAASAETSPDALAPYVGAYAVREITVEVTRADGSLRATGPPSRDPVALVPEGGDNFFWDVPDGVRRLKFVRDARGDVVGLEIHSETGLATTLERTE
jgi:hypothetical protein